MLGYFRFFLALCVVFSHLNFNIYVSDKLFLDIGKSAVFGFFVLAGYVSSKIFISVFDKDFVKFAKDRFLRIYPAFFIVTTISYLYFLCFEDTAEFELNFIKVFLTYLIIPLNYTNFIDLTQLHDYEQGVNFILPPFWSLGTEIQAYIVIELLILFSSKRAFLTTIYATLGIFFITALGFMDSEISADLNYILLLGTFWSFGLGYLIYKSEWRHIKFIIAVLTIILAVTLINDRFGYAREAILGAIMAVIMLKINLKFTLNFKLNRLLGNLSYHIFLCHFLMIYHCIETYGNIAVSEVLVLTFAFSCVLLLTDRLTNKIRFKSIKAFILCLDLANCYDLGFPLSLNQCHFFWGYISKS